MNFGAPDWLWGLLALPMLAALFVMAEKRSARRLRDFVAPRLLPQLAGEVNHFRRAVRFALQLLALALALVSLAHPRWGYTFEDVKRKGIDLLIAVDTSRSMLSNDVQPNRLERVKLATQDLITQLQGDRVGLIAFAGRAFIQAPLTIDYDAVVEAISDLDTKTIPEGGTNISEAITLAERTYGKSAVGNRALVIFTDGEELSGDAAKAAKAAADAGIRIFTVGVGTPQGSLIPLSSQDGGSAFVKDSKGQVVKSKLDEKRLREIAENTGGSYLHLENGPRTMQQLFADGLARLNAGEIDARLSRRPIERYEWPLGAAVVALALSIFISERKRGRSRIPARSRIKLATATAAAFILLLSPFASASTPGLNLYQDGKFAEAYETFQQDLKNHPDSEARDKMQFDAGAAAYQMRDYNKAAEAFSQALLTNDKRLQGSSHFNMGRTLEERADMSKTDDDALKDLTNAQTHYEDVLKLDPSNEAANANLEEVKKKIARLKDRRKPKPSPTPTPPPPQQKKGQDKDQGGGGGGKDQNDQKQQSQDQKKQSDSEQNQKGTDKQQQPQSKSESQKDQQAKNQNQSPSSQPGQPTPTASPSPGPGKTEKNEKPPQDNPPEPSPTAGEGENASPTPSPGEREGGGESPTPSAAPTEPPKKKLAGDVKGAADDKSPQPNQTPELANAEPEKEGEMSQRQAEALLESMKDEEARVQLDERRAARHVYNDW